MAELRRGESLVVFFRENSPRAGRAGKLYVDFDF
jgi:hypothetical protein